MASVTLNQAVSIWESGRRIHAFPGLFWTILSIGRYQDVMDVIESKEHREYLGARAYLKACKFLYKAFYLQFIFPSKAKQNIEQVKEYISNAHQILSTRKCESCGEVHNISTMFRVIDNTDTERIYCTNCYTPGGVICPNCGRSVPSDTVRNGHCNHCRETTQHSQQSQKQKKRTTQETGTKKSAEPELEQYCSVLDIEQPLTEDKIKSAYRDKSKAVHPDVDGGSEEKFKEVKTAKDQLLKLIN
jgi:uncharacterized Zn finger protein (UPF0148 family)